MRAIKVKIYPNNNQIQKLNQTLGSCRWVYNYALERKIKHYNETGKSLSIYKVSSDLPYLKNQEETCWLSEVNAQVLQQSLRNLESAFTNFFKYGYKFPKFKSKKSKQSCRFPQHFQISTYKKYIKLPKIGWIKFRDKFNFQNVDKFKSITVSKESDGNYFASILYEEKGCSNKQKIQTPNESNTVGIDLGVKDFANLSNSRKIKNPKYLDKYLKKLEKQQQKLSRCQKNSKRRQKRKKVVAKTYKKISNSRKDFIHKTINSLVENQDYVAFAIEDLSVQQMQENGHRKLSQLIGDAGWRMFRDILQYKAEERNKQVLVIGRWEASSKTCYCGVKNEKLTLDQREWQCDSCDREHDRDILAANNIKNFALAGQANVSSC